VLLVADFSLTLVFDITSKGASRAQSYSVQTRSELLYIYMEEVYTDCSRRRLRTENTFLSIQPGAFEAAPWILVIFPCWSGVGERDTLARSPE
jgi:hypothetical protein